MSENAGNDTRARIVDTARRLFAEGGYDGTTIRQIAVMAGVNVAAVNYHFGGKEALYEHVFTRAFDALLGADILPDTDEADVGAREALEKVIGRLVSDSGSHPASEMNRRILAWETINPTQAGSRLFASSARPHLKALSNLVRAYVGEGPDEQEVAVASLWLIGQFGQFRRAQFYVDRMDPDGDAEPLQSEQAAAIARRLAFGALDALREVKCA